MNSRLHARVLRLFVCAGFVICTASNQCWAIFANIGDDVPVDRLISNLERYVRDHPADAHGYYLLGRVHSMAFAKNARVIRVVEPDWKKPIDQESNPFKFRPYDRVQVKTSYDGRSLGTATRLHLSNSIQNYLRAVELDSKVPEADHRFTDEQLYLLGLGWMAETGARWAAQLGQPPVIAENPDSNEVALARARQLLEKLYTSVSSDREGLTRQIAAIPAGTSVIVEELERQESEERQATLAQVLRFAWRESALNAYRKAYRETLQSDLKKKEMYANNQMERVISLEAAAGIERILSSRQRMTDGEERELAGVRETVRHFKSLPQWVTPVIVGASENQPFSELVDSETTVRFDLDGTGRRQSWPWVKRDTGILVWDPDQSGNITSGRQLFGSVTWWLFWNHGYEALAALDDNDDGQLTSTELTGIGVWQDGNANGISDEGEVRQAKELNIVGISVGATIGSDGVLFNPQGIRLNDGRRLSTFDWVPRSMPHRDGSSVATVPADQLVPLARSLGSRNIARGK